jgi:hypothetical protein
VSILVLATQLLMCQDQNVSTPSSAPPEQPESGLDIKLKPFEDGHEQVKQFGFEFKSLNILPVKLTLRNLSHQRTFLFMAERVEVTVVGDNSGNAPNSIAGGEAFPLVYNSVDVSGPAGLSLAYANGERLKADSLVQQNLMLQRLQSGMILPGGQLQGFLYLRLPKDSSGNRKSKGNAASPRPKLCLKLRITEKGVSRPITFDFEF